MNHSEVVTTKAPSREELILEHLPQVNLIARRIHRGLPPSASLEDLISAGVVGLITAVDRYDSSQNVQLKTYAEHTIRGAMLDYLRKLDWAPRQQRRRAKFIETAVSSLEQIHGRAPSGAEVAKHLGLSMAEYHEWMSDGRALTLASLEASKSDQEGDELWRSLSDSGEHWPSELLEQAELKRTVAKAVKKMPKIEQTVLSMYFFEDKSLREIAGIVNLHESRISQLKSQAISRFRAHVQVCWPQQGAIRSAQLQSSAAYGHARV